MPGFPIPGLPPLPPLALDFSAGPSNAASSSPINVGGINTAAGGDSILLPALIAFLAWQLLK